MTVLLTGYEPFGDHETNPSAALARDLDGATVAGHEVVGRVLPVEFDAVRDELAAHLDGHDPDAVLGLGLAADRTALCVERVGLNVADAGSVPDNADAAPRGDPLDPAGADAHLATIPVTDVAAACLDAGVPARVSNTAGTHCCNAFLYDAVALTTRGDSDRERDESAAEPEVPAGFVHVPLTPAGAIALADGDAGGPTSAGGVPPSMSLDLQRRGIETAIEALV